MCQYRREGNRISRLTVAAAFCATVAISATAWSQYYAPVHGTVPHPSHYYGGAGTPVDGYCPCPPGAPSVVAPSPGGEYPTPVQEPTPVDDESDGEETTTPDTTQPVPQDYVPPVADLTGAEVAATAPESSVPNTIGNSIRSCGLFEFTSAGNVLTTDLCMPGGFRAAHNNSATPWSRFIYNYYYYNNAILASPNFVDQHIDIQTSEIGFEYAFFCDLMSVQVLVPFSHTVESSIVANTFTTVPEDLELGNVSLALKAMVYQDCYKSLSLGVGIDTPTADDFIIADPDVEFFLNNETIVVSPYMGWVAELTPNVFTQGFIQASIPMGNNSGRVNFFNGPSQATFDIRELAKLYIDLSLGAWLYRDECSGNGFAVISELHYTTTLDDPDAVLATGPVPDSVSLGYIRRDIIDATMGVMFRYGNLDTTFAYTTPLTDEEDRLFEGELMLQISRKF